MRILRHRCANHFIQPNAKALWFFEFWRSLESLNFNPNSVLFIFASADDLPLAGQDKGELMSIMVSPVPDPRDSNGPFIKLMKEIKKCKERKTCPNLTSRGYYFEPNHETIEAWKKDNLFNGYFDYRVMFVCESPGPQFKKEANDITRCWAITSQDERFLKARKEYGLHNCYITNSVKCGVRVGKRHTDTEIKSCLKYLIKEIELINPMVVVSMGSNAYYVMRSHVFPSMKNPPILFAMTHYSARGNIWLQWKQEFRELELLLSKLRQQDYWEPAG